MKYTITQKFLDDFVDRENIRRQFFVDDFIVDNIITDLVLQWRSIMLGVLPTPKIEFFSEKTQNIANLGEYYISVMQQKNCLTECQKIIKQIDNFLIQLFCVDSRIEKYVSSNEYVQLLYADIKHIGDLVFGENYVIIEEHLRISDISEIDQFLRE